MISEPVASAKERLIEVKPEQISVSALGGAEIAAAVAAEREGRLLHAFGIACVVVDARGVILSWSQGAAEMFGFSAEEAVGVALAELPLMSPGLAVSLQARLREDLELPMEADALFLRKGGTRFPARIRTIACLDTDGRYDGAAGLVIDLSRDDADRAAPLATSRNTAVAEISRLAAADTGREEFRAAVMKRLASLLDLELVGLVTVDPGTGGARLEAGHGWDDELAGGHRLGARHPDLDLLLPAADPVLVTHPSAAMLAEDGLLGPHGVRAGISVAVGARPALGALVAFSCVPRDFGRLEIELMQSVALVIEAAEARERSRELEQRVDRVSRMEAMGQLTGGIAHDFNNLLAVILNYAAFAREEAHSDEDVDPGDSIQEIEVAAKRAAELTHQLLVFSRQEVVEAEPVAVGDAVADARALLARTLGESIVLVTEIEPGLPPVEIGPGQIEQIVVNLAVNARDAMPDGGELRIEVGGVGGDRGEQSWIQITITDTGSGMSREVIEKAFEPFFTTKEVGQGSGLGLATVYGVLSAVGGSVELRSEEGAGTTVDIALPAVNGGSLEPRQFDDGPADAAGSGQGRVLLIEDDEMVRRLAVRVLEGGGYSVTATDDAAAALRLLADPGSAFDAVLSDVVMPVMSGPELIEQARKARPDLRVVFMSGYAGDSLSPESIGDATFVEKPFTPETLLQSIREALR